MKIDRIKYPRTLHLPWSLSISSDDKVLKTVDHFLDKEVIITEKRDGENTTWYNDYIHARSLDSKNHPSRNYNKQHWNSVKNDIPDGWRLCGENLYAKHSIHYTDLETYFEIFSIWNDQNICLSWDETLEWCNLLKLKTVPMIFRGIFNETYIKSLKLDLEKTEGYVIRLANSFSYDNFSESVAKFVRKNHVQQNSTHWSTDKIIPNIIKNS